MFGGFEINKLPNKTELDVQINHCFNSFRDLQGGVSNALFSKLCFQLLHLIFDVRSTYYDTHISKCVF